jgi:hypothetical protein
MIIAELGVFIGTFSEIILKICNPKELYLIDIWSKSVKSGDKDGKNLQRFNLPIIYQQLLEKYKNNPIVKLYKTDTISALNSFPNNYFDLIYIDANHRYKAVWIDLKLSLIKSKKYIAGHDYNPNSGVQKAVNQFCSLYNLQISYLTKDGCPSFLIEKI